MEQLTRERLPAVIAAAGRDPGAVSFYGAHEHDRIVIDHRAVGWVVFYSERGGEFDLAQHDSEAAACRDVLDRLGIAP